MYQQLIMWVGVLVVFYFLLIMPERKKQKKFNKMIEALKVGDEVLTRSGIYGKIVNLKEDYMIVESGAEKTRLKMTRVAVATVISSKEDKDVKDVKDEKDIKDNSAEDKK